MTGRRCGGRTGVGAALMLAVLATGCAALQRDPFEVEDIGPCPEVLVLREAATGVWFVPESSGALTDVMYQTAIEPARSICSYDDEANAYDIELEVAISATVGPAIKDFEITVPYFISVVGPGGKILVKEVFESEMAFEPGDRWIEVEERSLQSIFPGPNDSGADFDIVIGLQLTPEQLAYNRKAAAAQ